MRCTIYSVSIKLCLPPEDGLLVVETSKTMMYNYKRQETKFISLPSKHFTELWLLYPISLDSGGIKTFESIIFGK